MTAPSPQSPDGQENPHGCAESLLEADKEMVERTEPGTDLLVAMATVVAEKYSYLGAVDDVLRCLANGKRPRNVWFSLLALLIDYDPICGQSPGTFFRKHLDSLPDSSPDDE